MEMEEDNTVFPSGWRSANVNLERQPIHSLVNMRRSFESHNEELNIDKRVAEEITLHARSTPLTTPPGPRDFPTAEAKNYIRSLEYTGPECTLTSSHASGKKVVSPSRDTAT